MPRRSLRLLAAIGTLGLVALATMHGTFFSGPRDSAASVQSASEAVEAPAPLPAPHRASLVTIGDSIMAGHGVSEGEDWVTILAADKGWNVTNLAVDGAGFLTIGDDGHTFADQAQAAVALDPDLIIIQGSSNDFGADDSTLETETLATVAYLHAALPDTEIIGLSTIWGDDYYPDQLLEINDQVQRATAISAGIYLDLAQPIAGGVGLIQPDAIHPTALGQRALADAIENALTNAGVVY